MNDPLFRDFADVSEKLAPAPAQVPEPSPFPIWHIVAVFALTGLFYVAWFMEKVDEATTPALTLATGAEYAGAGK